MNFQAYRQLFEKILNTPLENQTAPYNNTDYLNYTKLNWSRMNRWLQTAKLNPTLIETIKNIQEPQTWIIITEPWCGDAAHNVPFIEMLAALNPLITTHYELRDSEPFTIEKYLTNGSKSIPKLIIRNKDGEDIDVWGPRPNDCQLLYNNLTNQKATFDTIKIELQNWYNQNKGKDLQNELAELLGR